ncbi:hypothetical protein FBU59_003098 [Linderina macrospora]|uniref:Uncharacterized protein n=1 Tax=Linderina macrospora TaxID=4868 RepID=A0ACC1J9E4_9FUNG|nr:hypothetical protein FBU59_003098 [Linderina macrospora]
MFAKLSAIAAVAAVVAANPPVYPVANAHNNAYLTVTGPPAIAQPPAVVVAPSSVVQNAGTDETTITSTITNGAGTNALGMGAVALAGSIMMAYL